MPPLHEPFAQDFHTIRPPTTALAGRLLISDLLADLEAYLPPDQIREVYKAYLFGAEAHEGQHRKSGEPYIYHPIAVALILAKMRMDHKCLIAALLHDVIEDTPHSREQIAEQFDEEIAHLVDGVTKLSKIDFKSKAEAQAASLRKMVLAMTKDARVILIKFADRIHNMRTLGVMPPPKSRRISRETLEIYAPLAQRLGIHAVCSELEDLGFAHYWPWRYCTLFQAVGRIRSEQRALFHEIEASLSQCLGEQGIQGEITQRPIDLYGIYRRMRDERIPFAEIEETLKSHLEVRIVVEQTDTCYRVLGLAHQLYKPITSHFKDHIAIPMNNHQFLYTVLVGPEGLSVRLQICTRAMAHTAQFGILEHWMHSAPEKPRQGPALTNDWFQNLLEVDRGSSDSIEFLENFKDELSPSEIYVFTPRGRLVALPEGATVLDFAYAIHSDLGNRCGAARIDRIPRPLSTPLQNGQTVEIIATANGRPSASWLSIVITGKARAAIRSYLKNLQRREAEAMGRRLLQEALEKYEQDLERLPEAILQAYLEETNLPDLSQLLVEIGLGNRLPTLVAHHLAQHQDASMAARPSPERFRANIRGTEGVAIKYPSCCFPIPGDRILGVFCPSQGLLVHRWGCKILGAARNQRDRWLDLTWADDYEGVFSSEIRLELEDRRGALAIIAQAIADQDSNIENVQVLDKDAYTAVIDFRLSVYDRTHLARIMRRLRKIPFVSRITRMGDVSQKT